MASGRLVPISISKTVFSPSPVVPSTAIPIEVRSCARRRLSTLGSTNSRSHVGESFIVDFRSGGILPAVVRASCPHSTGETPPRQPPGRRRYGDLSELLQKSYISVKEQLNVVHPVFQNC